MVEKRLAIIPARGGSKRIPRKNLVEFFGQPMIAWTIKAAIASNLFDRVLVSTDCAEIARISMDFGAEVPFMRSSCADDISTVSEATIYAIEQAKSYWKEDYKTVVQLMANCPLRNADDIKQAVRHFEKNDEAFQISCFKYGWMNPWWAHQLNDNGEPKALFNHALTERSQDLDELYCPTGAIWIAQRNALLSAGTFYGAGHKFFPLSWQSAVDIDDMDDLAFAKVVKRVQQEEDDG